MGILKINTICCVSTKKRSAKNADLSVTPAGFKPATF